MNLTTINDVCSRSVQAFHWRNVGSASGFYQSWGTSVWASNQIMLALDTMLDYAVNRIDGFIRDRVNMPELRATFGVAQGRRAA
jgi:hypothetical protein